MFRLSSIMAVAIATVTGFSAQGADFGFFGRSGDAIDVNFAVLPGVPVGAAFTDLSLSAGFTSHTLLGSTLTGVPFSTSGRFWAYANPAASGDTSGARGWQGTLSGTLKINGESKSFDLTVRPGYTASVGQSLEAINRPANNKSYVAQQQQRLRYLGFVAEGGAALVVDGDFGPATNTALKTFQAATIGGVNTTQANADGIIGPNTAAWLNATNAPAWGQVASNVDVTISNQINERHATSWTADRIYAGSALAKARGLGNQQTNALSMADGYGSSAYHQTHRVGTDIDLYTGVFGAGNGSLSTLEQKVANQAVAFLDAAASGPVIRILVGNTDVRTNILAQRGGANVELDTSGGHRDHLHIDVGAPARAGGRSNLGGGDFNMDDVVNAADLAVWRQYLGTNFTGNDLLTWQRTLGNSQTPIGAVPASQPVPEPQALALLAWGVVALWRRPLRRNR